MKKLYYYWKIGDVIPQSGFFNENDKPNLSQLITEPYLHKPIVVNDVVIEGITEEELVINSKKEIINGIKLKYEFHRENGWKAYQEFRAKVVSDIYDGLITELEAFLIEANLKVAYDRISQNGDWKTARYELLQVSPYPPFVEPYYNLAMDYINNYITNNYED
ncbi:hypothetical protein FIA58_013755 [Flavobacterium jejuense]|uniref:Uncharacterized protein n=1 Tax=Flavobacterium jejuense TaxID=1544455 RepID=A0ABX0IYD0_9FLAO|nr:hypothetical protein [Flavobacterium jejuense]NHN26745.1 hypothetical protein [Flavobacterium jejuense]